MVEHAKQIFWHHHHTISTGQYGEQPSRHKETHTVAAVYTHKRTINVTGIRLKMLAIHYGTTAWHLSLQWIKMY